jgi:quercetin dioxygenase-like cupin family protein
MSTTPVQQFRWDDMPLEHVTGMLSRRIVTGERAMLAQITLKKGTIVPQHEHESEQISFVVQGALRFTIEGRDHLVRAGEVLLIPSRVPHQAEAIEDTVEFDTFSPIRQDWLDKTDDYFQR